MKAIGYIRVLTTAQATDGVSLEAQRGRIEAWCTQNGYRLDAVYSDAGLSGSRADNRPALCKAMDAASKSRGAALVVYSLSRLARSTKDAIAIAERLDKAGADLVSLSERIDTTTAAGKMVFRMLAVLAEFERDLVSERTTAAMALKRANGQRISGRIPYGFDLAADGVALVPNEAEQAVIADIRAMREKRATLKRIASALSDRGVATKTGRSTRWTPSGGGTDSRTALAHGQGGAGPLGEYGYGSPRNASMTCTASLMLMSWSGVAGSTSLRGLLGAVAVPRNASTTAVKSGAISRAVSGAVYEFSPRPGTNAPLTSPENLKEILDSGESGAVLQSDGRPGSRTAEDLMCGRFL